jgi:glucose-6-phosphate-specific signal transduction histidine kinase
MMMAKKYRGEADYSYVSAIIGGLFFSLFLSFNLLTFFIIWDYEKIVKMIVTLLGLGGFFLLLILPFVFVYFSCIYNKKYISLSEHFNFMDKNLKNRLLGVMLLTIHMGGSIIFFVLSLHFFK